jgi:ribonuclease T2
MLRNTGLIALAVFALAAYFLMGRAPDQQQESSTQTAPQERTSQPPVDSARKSAKTANAEFDFYVLSLSWSPSFCASNEGSNNRQQCGIDKNHGFVVHGLWPQNDQGYPEFCASQEPDRVPQELGRRMFDIMPSMGLIGHQWRKHGSCSGLNQKAYFELTRRAYDKIKVPAELDAPKTQLELSPNAIERKFIEMNPGLSNQSIAVTCDSKLIEEVRICLNTDLSFRSCPEVDRKSCRARSTIIPAI